MAAATMQELDANLAAATETSTAVNLMPAGLLGNLQTGKNRKKLKKMEIKKLKKSKFIII